MRRDKLSINQVVANVEGLALVLVTGVFVSISALFTLDFYGALLLFLSLLLPLLSFASFILVRISIFTSVARLDIIFYIRFICSLVFLSNLVRLSFLFGCSYHLLFPALEIFLWILRAHYFSFFSFHLFLIIILFFAVVLTFFLFLFFLHSISFFNIVFCFSQFFLHFLHFYFFTFTIILL